MKTTLLSATAVAALAGAAAAQCSSEKLLAPDRQWYDHFGASAAMGPADLFIGAPADDNVRGTDAGSIYWYTLYRGTWQYQSRIQSAGTSAGFGRSLATDGQTLVIGGEGGAAAGGYPAGSMWIMTKGVGNAWYPAVGALNGSAAGDDFGCSVAVNGATAAVGARGRDYQGQGDMGSVYVYRRNAQNQWNYLVEIIHPTFSSAAGDRQGTAVAVSDTGIIAVGSPGSDFEDGATHADSGKVMIFVPSGGSYALAGTGGTINGYWPQVDGRGFGSALAFDGEYLAVGMPGYSANPYTDQGAVQFFRRQADGSWDSLGVWSGSASNAALGARVSMKGGWAVVSSPGTDEVALFKRTVTGSAYAYQGSLPASEFGATNQFGSSVATNGAQVILGDSNFSPDPYVWAGAADAYSILPDNGNDLPVGSTALDVPSTVYGCTMTATPTTNIPGMCGSSSDSPDLYYTWTADFTGPVVMHTDGSGYDTVLSAHTSAPYNGYLNLITCDDDGGTGNASRIRFNAVAGHQYTIRVSGYSGATGSYVLTSYRDCPADFNGDGFVDFFDYDDYVNCFETGACPENKTADFNGDGFADFFDYDEFVTAFEVGC